VIRFWDNEVLTNMDGVLTAILDALNSNPHPGQFGSRPVPQTGPRAAELPQAGEGE
jgi:hypothetical protein